MKAVGRKAVVLSGPDIERSLSRIAHEIDERNHGLENLVLVGIRTGGALLVARLAEKLQKIGSGQIPVGIIDITLYRDDLMTRTPIVQTTEVPFSIEDRDLVLVDDVLFTGRTIRAALDALIDLGRPKSIQLAILVDRGHRELPIQADYIGRKIETDRHERVKLIADEGKPEQVVLLHGMSSI